MVYRDKLSRMNLWYAENPHPCGARGLLPCTMHPDCVGWWAEFNLRWAHDND